MTRVLVVGVPRSGSTWVARMLERTKDACLVDEPDNQYHHAFAARAQQDLPGGFFPVLAPNAEAPEYEALWSDAFGARGARHTPVERLRRKAAKRLFSSVDNDAIRRVASGVARAPIAMRAARALAVPERPPRLARTVLVKSVYSALAVEWIAERTQARVVLVTRDVRNVVSSHMKMGWFSESFSHLFNPTMTLCDAKLEERVRVTLGAPRPPQNEFGLERLTWFTALSTLALESAGRRHADWELVRHEDLCANPLEGLRALAENLGLPWTSDTSAAIAATDRPGEGYEVHRVASELPSAYRSRLTSDQVAKVEAQLAQFPLESFIA